MKVGEGRGWGGVGGGGLGDSSPKKDRGPASSLSCEPSQTSSQLAPGVHASLSLSGIFVLFPVTELSHRCLSEGPGSQREILNHQSPAHANSLALGDPLPSLAHL